MIPAILGGLIAEIRSTLLCISAPDYTRRCAESFLQVSETR